MKALAIMQNQWLRNAEVHERRYEELRRTDMEKWRLCWRRGVQFSLFRGCRSGQVLTKHLGADVCDEVVWDEASRVIGSNPSDCPPADLDHIRWTLEDVKPDVVITFGRIASDAVDAVLDPGHKAGRMFNGIHPLIFIQSPHPAARGGIMQESVREACVAFLNAIGRY